MIPVCFVEYEKFISRRKWLRKIIQKLWAPFENFALFLLFIKRMKGILKSSPVWRKLWSTVWVLMLQICYIEKSLEFKKIFVNLEQEFWWNEEKKISILEFTTFDIFNTAPSPICIKTFSLLKNLIFNLNCVHWFAFRTFLIRWNFELQLFSVSLVII